MSRSVLSQMITLANEISRKIRLTGCRVTGPVADRWMRLLVATASRRNRWYLGVWMWDPYSCVHICSPFHVTRLHLSGKVPRKRCGTLSSERTRAAINERSYWGFHPFLVESFSSRLPRLLPTMLFFFVGQLISRADVRRDAAVNRRRMDRW